MQTKTSNRYHHGNLRNALVVAAAELIEESGSEDFAMVDAARRAGVSSGAPYRHFADREDLLRAVAELGYYEMATRLIALREQHETGTSDCIIALGKCYLSFVVSKPAFFDLMWGERGSRALAELDAAHSEMRANGFWLLVDQVSAWAQKNGLYDISPDDLALKLWAMCIGTSHMAINYDLERYVADVDLDNIVETSTHAFLRGVIQGQKDVSE